MFPVASHNYPASEEEKCKKEEEKNKKRPHEHGSDPDKDVDPVYEATSEKKKFSKDLARNKAAEGETQQRFSCTSQDSREGTSSDNRCSSSFVHAVEVEG